MDNENWGIVERLFHTALKLPYDERLVFLSRAAKSPSEFESAKKLLDAAEMAEDFMQTSIGLEPPRPSLQKGQILGNWKILSNIGLGGMGEIYRVEHCDSSFTQIAALKIARTRDKKYLRRFEQERRILAQLEHPNIGRFIDGGLGPNKDPYFVMEIVEGESITSYIENNQLGITDRLSLFKQLCEALSHAHRRLILHRDIKPSNIMVTMSGQVKLLDFGISDQIHKPDETLTPITRAYAAPEQVRGERVTTATDIYSLGAVLHHMISGERIGQRRTVTRDLPSDIQAIIGKCLNTEPQDRYGTVDGLKDDIERYLQKRPVQARGGGRFYALRKSLGRNRFAFSVSALFVVSLITGLIGTYSQMRKAQAAKLEQEFEARTLAGYSYGLQTLYSHDINDPHVIDPAKIDASMISLAETVKTRFDGKSLNDAFLLYSMGQVMANRRDFHNAARFLEPLQDLSVDTPIALNLLFEARSDLARCWVELGESEKAERLIRTLLSERHDKSVKYDLGHVQDALGLATLTGRSEDLENAINISQKTLKKWESEKADINDRSWLYNQIGTAYFQTNNIPEAIEAFEQAFYLNRQGGIQSLDDITSATNLAQFQIFLNRDGHAPLIYLSDYLKPSLNEFGAPSVYAFIQGLRAEAALLNKDWSLALDAVSAGIPYLAETRDYRDGWYYEMIVMQVRALSQLNQPEEARHILDQALMEFDTEPDTSSWGFTACKLRAMDGYVSILLERIDKGRRIFENGFQQCQSASAIGWENEKVIPPWFNDLRSEVSEYLN